MMTFKALKKGMLPAAILLTTAVVTGTYAIAQMPAHQSGSYGIAETIDVFEKQIYIRDCRDVISSVQADVYPSSDLVNGTQATPVQRLPGGTQVRLTGLLRGSSQRYTAAQIYLNGKALANGHAVGWVRVDKLTQTTQFCPQ